MPLKRSPCAQPHRRIRRHVHNSDAYTFFNLLTRPELLGEVESLLPQHREWLFPPDRDAVDVSRAGAQC